MSTHARIGYLAPELPALSATFVYEELLALERRGFPVLPISVRRPVVMAAEHANLSERTVCVYDKPAALIVGSALLQLPFAGAKGLKAVRWLLSDMSEVGWTKSAAWKLAFQFLAAVKLAKTLRDGHCVHLHVHFAHVPTQIAMYASALAGVPFTIMAHANDIFERGLLLQRKAERSFCMMTISKHNQRYLESLGIPPEQLAVVRCGVSFAAVKYVRRFHGERAFQIGTLGRMVEKKGFDVLIRALAALMSSGRSVELQIAGDGPLKSELESLARDLGVEDAVHFLGSLSHVQVASWMQGLDLFALACKQDRNGDMDGIPVVLMEAMSQSVPVVSTNLSGIPELVVDEQTGLLAQPGDVADLARQIGRLIESNSLADTLAANGREHVVHEFGQSTNIDRLLKCFGFADGTGSINFPCNNENIKNL